MAETEKINGTKGDPLLGTMWVREDMELAEMMANEGLGFDLPKFKDVMNKAFGNFVVFGTPGEITPEEFQQIVNPFNMKKDE